MTSIETSIDYNNTLNFSLLAQALRADELLEQAGGNAGCWSYGMSLRVSEQVAQSESAHSWQSYIRTMGQANYAAADLHSYIDSLANAFNAVTATLAAGKSAQARLETACYKIGAKALAAAKARRYASYEHIAPNWTEVRWGFIIGDWKKIRSQATQEQRTLVSQVTQLLRTAKFTPWRNGFRAQAFEAFAERKAELLKVWPEFVSFAPNLNWALRYQVTSKQDMRNLFAGCTPFRLGNWKRPQALRVSRALNWVLIKNGKGEGKQVYMQYLAQADVHPDFGQEINDWLDKYKPINRNGLGYGVEFRPVDKTGYVSHDSKKMEWKIPSTQTVEHWASDAEVVAFEVCKNRNHFKAHCTNFWVKVRGKQRRGKKILVLAPKAVIDYRLKAKV